MKLSYIIERYFKNNCEIAAKKTVNATGNVISSASMRNMKADKRDALELADGRYIVTSKQTIIIDPR